MPALRTRRPKALDRKAALRFASVGEQDGVRYVFFEGEPNSSRLFPAEDGTVTCERDIILDVFCLTTGQAECSWLYNKHAHHDLSATPFHRERAIRLALASSLGRWLETTFQTLRFPSPTPRWPAGKRAAAYLSHCIGPHFDRTVWHSDLSTGLCQRITNALS
jgi:hypothetical protein